MLSGTEKIKRYIEKEYLLEFNSPEECLKFFNTYDYQNFKSVDEMKAYQGKYGFSYNGKYYHICVDAALDVREYIGSESEKSGK